MFKTEFQFNFSTLNLRYWELKEGVGIKTGGKYSLSHKHKEEIQVIFHKAMNLQISSILNNNIVEAK